MFFGGGGARRAGGTMRRQKTGHRKRSGALSRRKSLPPAYADTRTSPLAKEQNRMIPRFSGIRHVFDTRAKTYLPICGSRGARRRRNCNAFGPYTRPTPEKDPTNREIHPWNCIEHPEMQLQLLDFAHIFAHLRFEIGKSHLTNNHIPISR